MPPSRSTPTTAPTSVPIMGNPLLLTLPLWTQGNVFIVNPSATFASDAASHGTIDRPFKTIGFAHSRAKTANGDYILVYPGTYTENVTITKDSITIAAVLDSVFGHPNIAPTSGTALTINAQGFGCRGIQCTAASDPLPTVVQSGNGYRYYDCVFDGNNIVADPSVFRLVPDPTATARQASQGEIMWSTFRNGGQAGLLFDTPSSGVQAGTYPSEVKVVYNTFYNNNQEDIRNNNFPTSATPATGAVYSKTIITNNWFLDNKGQKPYVTPVLAAGPGSNNGLVAGNWYGNGVGMLTAVEIASVQGAVGAALTSNATLLDALMREVYELKLFLMAAMAD